MPTTGYSRPGVGTLGPQVGVRDNLISPTLGSSLWESCPLSIAANDPRPCIEFFDDFIGIVTGSTAWITTAAVTGTAVAGALAGGTAALNAGAVTANQGIQIQRAGGHVVPLATKHIWFECRFKVNVLTAQLLCGLCDIDTTLIAAGVLHPTDMIGFSSVTGDGVMLTQAIKASAAAPTQTATTLVAATYVHLGFVVTDLTKIDYYVNGTLTKTVSTAANISVVSLTPSFVCQANGTGTPQMDLDYVMVVQIR